ncbi:MAG: hypothetical protein HYY22_01420 [Thaumarchaeota archaeon]|nr:hypothetical protein [Nitrososphaerota archaeon]
MSVIILCLLTLSPLNVFAATPLIIRSSFTLSFQGYDYDNKGEVVILINSKVAASLPVAESPSNSGVWKSFSLDITKYVVSGSNTLAFKENSSHASGMKNVKVTGSGGTTMYSNSTSYTLSSNGRTQVTYRFSAIAAPIIGTLSVTTPVDGQVFVDGVSWGFAPVSKFLSPGSHTVSFGAIFGYTKPVDVTVSITTGSTSSVTGTYTEISTPISSRYTLSFQGYDYDNEDEVSILVNNQLAGSLPVVETSTNDHVFRSFSLDISKYVVSGSNTVVFRQNIYSSGVKDVKVTGTGGSILLGDGTYHDMWVGGTSSVTYEFATGGEYSPPTVDVYTFNVHNGRQMIFNSTDVVRIGAKISGGQSSISQVMLSITGPAGFTSLDGILMESPSSEQLYDYFYDYALPSPPVGAYFATVSVEFSDGSSELSYNWFKSMRQTITDNGPWTTTAGGTAQLSFSLSSLGSESHDTSLFIDLPNSAAATSATLDGQPWTLKAGTGAPTGYTRYYMPYIYIDIGATITVNFNVKISSSAALGGYAVNYFSEWKTYEGYRYSTKSASQPTEWIPNTVPSGHYARLQRIDTSFGDGWSVDTQGSPDYIYYFMGWTSETIWTVPSDGKITVSGAFLKSDTFDVSSLEHPEWPRSFMQVYVLNSDGTRILGSAYAVNLDDQTNVWYRRTVTITGLTPGEIISIGIGRRDEWISDWALYAKWANIHVLTDAGTLTIK